MIYTVCYNKASPQYNRWGLYSGRQRQRIKVQLEQAQSAVAKPVDERIGGCPATVLLTKENLGEISVGLTNGGSAWRTTSPAIPTADKS